MNVEVVTAKVYKANGRRYFSKRSAFLALAWQMISRKYPCDCAPSDESTRYSGETCLTHTGTKYNEIAFRLSKKLMRNFKGTGEVGA